MNGSDTQIHLQSTFSAGVGTSSVHHMVWAMAEPIRMKAAGAVLKEGARRDQGRGGWETKERVPELKYPQDGGVTTRHCAGACAEGCALGLGRWPWQWATVEFTLANLLYCFAWRKRGGALTVSKKTAARACAHHKRQAAQLIFEKLYTCQKI